MTNKFTLSNKRLSSEIELNLVASLEQIFTVHVDHSEYTVGEMMMVYDCVYLKSYFIYEDK